MNLQEIQDRNLEEKIRYLKQRLLPQIGQASVREVLAVGEMQEIHKKYDEYCHEFEKEQSGKDLDQDPPNFNLYFDTNGVSNFAFLARRRKVSTNRLVLDLAVEIGLLTEADYQRYVGQMDFDSVVRSSVPYHFHDGSLYRGGKLIGSIQTRVEPTGQQVVLQNFEQLGWPNSIPAPNLSWKQLRIENPKLSGEELRKLTSRQWSSAKVKSVCLQLRKSFKNELHFGEGEGGKLIRMKDIASQDIAEDKTKVKPK